jgi:TRAP-type C4-dicarboxylate transport system permease small subunit
VSWFLVAFGVWSWIVWTTFVKNLWQDVSGLAFHHGDHSSPTAYFWIHLTLAIVSTALGTAIGLLGLRSLRQLRQEQQAELPAQESAEPPVVSSAQRP